MPQHDDPTDEPTVQINEDAERQMRNRLLSQLDKAEASNRETLEQLQRRGNPPSAIALTRVRLELLINAMLGNQDSVQRLQFELVWQRELQEVLAKQYSTPNAKLHVPGR